MKHRNSIAAKPLSARSARYGRMFVLLWVIGFLWFFLIPLGQSILFSFSKVSIGMDGFETEFLGLQQYYTIFLEDPNYTRLFPKA